MADILINPNADTSRIIQFVLDQGYTREEAESVHKYALSLTNFNEEYIMDKCFNDIFLEWLEIQTR